ncbi:hypothetical protein GGR57DRAFT_437348 [Xylariaceae sp. FL1272]|nr:hypothetical protein GGR57DRAFT_437348 [Xylariaceae sp. FL1272]
MAPKKRTVSYVDLTESPPNKAARHNHGGSKSSIHPRRSISSPNPSQLTPPSSLRPSSQLNQSQQTVGEDDFVDDDVAETPPLEFYGTMDNKIVGVRYYNGIVTPGESIICRREPRNQYDPNAVRIDNIMGNQVGHLPRNLVKKLAPYLDRDDVLLDGVLNGHKGPFDCPVRLYFYGPSDPSTRSALEQKLKDDKLLKATELKNSRKEAEAQRAIADGLKDGTPALGLGSTDYSESASQVLEDSEETDFRANPSAFDVLNMDEATLSALPKASQPDAIKTKLLVYQLQGLAWLESKEHPQLPAPGSDDIVQLWKRKDANYENIASCHVTHQRPKLLSGGILSDDMGLGKTLQTISLIMNGGFDSGPTLIIAPKGVMSNWEQQFEEHVQTDRLPRILKYHGSPKFKSFKKADLMQFDVVITSYGKLTSEFNPSNPVNSGALFDVSWRRIVLDEGHCIRNPATKTAKAACHLVAQTRWILSGTPFVNKATDFWSALLFLKITGGIQESGLFNAKIARPLEGLIKDKNNSARLKLRGEAQALFQLLVQDLCLRRKKSMAFINLKMVPKTEYVHKVRFTNLEMQRYRMMLTEARGALQQFLAKSYKAAGKNRKRKPDDGKEKVQFASVLEALLRLRQMCDHWSLTGTRMKAILEKLGDQDIVALTPENVQILLSALTEAIFTQEECPICYDPIGLHDPVITACKHRFGRPCILNAIKQQQKCPMCRQEVTEDDLLDPKQIETKGSENTDVDADKEGRSSKTAQLEIIVEKHLRDPKSKIVIFSQWTSFLNIIQKIFSEKNIKCCRIDGTMDTKRRDEAVQNLKEDPETRIMLASLHAAGVGVNLTAADTIILTDCWWAPAIEDQAVDRVHRIGQTRPVTVYKLLVEGSVEYCVLDIQAEKRKLVALAFQDEDDIKNENSAISDIQRILYADEV